MNQLTHGLAFHPEFALCRPSAPYDDPSRLERLRRLLEDSRGMALRQAAEEAEGAGNEDACRELRRKAAEHEGEALPAFKDVDRFEAMLEQVEGTLDKVRGEGSEGNTRSDDKDMVESERSSLGQVEEQLEETLHLDDECPGWLLGPSLSAVDLSLAAALNRLAQLGLQRLWVNCERRRPRVERLLREAQQRPSFKRAVPEVGLADGRPPYIPRERKEEAGESGAGREGEDEEAPKLGTDESIDVWKELKRGISVEEKEGEEGGKKEKE